MHDLTTAVPKGLLSLTSHLKPALAGPEALPTGPCLRPERAPGLEAPVVQPTTWSCGRRLSPLVVQGAGEHGSPPYFITPFIT